MPNSACGHVYNNSITIGSIGTFSLSQEDYQVAIGTEGAKSLNVKIGSFVDSVNTYRVEYLVALHHVERSIFEAIKLFAKEDILSNYLNISRGSISLDLGGERYTGCVIKKIDITGPSAIMPGTPEVEYLEKIELRILAPSYRII